MKKLPAIVTDTLGALTSDQALDSYRGRLVCYGLVLTSGP